MDTKTKNNQHEVTFDINNIQEAETQLQQMVSFHQMHFDNDFKRKDYITIMPRLPIFIHKDLLEDCPISYEELIDTAKEIVEEDFRFQRDGYFDISFDEYNWAFHVVFYHDHVCLIPYVGDERTELEKMGDYRDE
ncbi:hypothetical protein Pla110_32980 [Polystyrenella longa]|uniref:Uncharacterized protein n=1 Tax=Polystyrenella longa TaxID=2528007 RepID=A0A518CQQ2_9PLAN|nr:DUF3387 domain-containing protein [Polystyrenella longa]QDU81556.1 hypothetical protein Pla110_32980 [Polystyrenella longa]